MKVEDKSLEKYLSRGDAETSTNISSIEIDKMEEFLEREKALNSKKIVDNQIKIQRLKSQVETDYSAIRSLLESDGSILQQDNESWNKNFQKNTKYVGYVASEVSLLTNKMENLSLARCIFVLF
eukprot:maker-scaffold_9-snap-gene-12.50-mRNA-1 protein AED:0.41 eAED:0.41 QI:0/1/0.5/1/1/1/2/71/123